MKRQYDSLLISNLHEALVPFTLCKIQNGEVVWNNFIASKKILRSNPLTNEAVLESFSYGIIGNRYFDEISFDSFTRCEALAEIYPGGSNAGGSRSGIVSGYNVKGLGANILLGETEFDWYSYGGLSLYEATLEVANTLIFDKLLPHGCINCFAIIKTGDKTALHPTGKLLDDNRGKGALLIRELCVRPAHFFPLENFNSNDNNHFLNEQNQNRVSSLCTKLFEELGGIEALNSFILSFYSKLAAQFSAAKIFRIFHGALNYSNISFDGRWLDVSTASFVDSGKDYGKGRSLPSFFIEHISPINYVSIFREKYEGFISTESIVKHYSNQLRIETTKSFVKLLGINLSLPEAIFLNPITIELSMKIWSCITSTNNENHTEDLPSSLLDSDPVITELRLMHSEINYNILKQMESDTLISKLFNLIFADMCITSFEDKSEFIRSTILRSNRLFYGREFFLGGKIRKYIDHLVRTKSINHIDSYLTFVGQASAWIFNFDEVDVSLFRSEDCNIIFSNNYFVFNVGRYKKQTKSAATAYKIALHIDNKYFLKFEYDFKKMLLKTIESLL